MDIHSWSLAGIKPVDTRPPGWEEIWQRIMDPPVPMDWSLPQSLRSSYRGSFKAPLSLSPHFTQDRLAAQGFKRNFFSRNFSHTVAFMSSPAAISISTNFSEQCVLLAQAAPCLVLASLEFRSSMSVTCKGGLGSEVCQSLSLALIQVPRYLIM